MAKVSLRSRLSTLNLLKTTEHDNQDFSSVAILVIVFGCLEKEKTFSFMLRGAGQYISCRKALADQIFYIAGIIISKTYIFLPTPCLNQYTRGTEGECFRCIGSNKEWNSLPSFWSLIRIVSNY